MLDLSKITPLKAEPYPYNAEQEAWLKELETTDKPQGFGLLRNGKGQYCCLGIACEVLGYEAQPHEGAHVFLELGSQIMHNAYLPPSASEKLRLNGESGRFVNAVHIEAKYLIHALTGMNDAHSYGGIGHAFTFKDIAAYIRHDPWNVFHGPEDAAPPQEAA